MKEIEFEVDLTVGDLYAFSMRHTYGNVSGIFGLVLSIGSWLICLFRYESMDLSARMALFVIGCLFTIVQPVMLFFKSAMQMKQNKNINTSLRYRLSEEGITVKQGEQEGHAAWNEIRNVVVTKRAAYVYMSAVRAFIFPASQCGEDFEEVCRMLQQQREQYKD